MPIWLIILLIVLAVLIGTSSIVHRHVIKNLIQRKPLGKAPKWHVWLPKKMRVQ
jgi:hypothetical protein